MIIWFSHNLTIVLGVELTPSFVDGSLFIYVYYIYVPALGKHINQNVLRQKMLSLVMHAWYEGGDIAGKKIITHVNRLCKKKKLQLSLPS